MKNLKKTYLKYFSFWLIPIFILALFLRWVYLPRGAISFAYDQARDAFLVQQMINGNMMILGPPVSGIPGLFHGVLYYYIIAPAYYLGHGNPVFVAYFLSFISSLGIFSVYLFSRILTRNKTASLLSALLFAVSFESSQYANLMTNASMGVWFVPLTYLGLYLWITGKTKYASLITGLFFGLSVQSEVALLYHATPLAFWLFVNRKSIEKGSIFKFIASFAIGIFPMIISEIKFGFPSKGAFMYLVTGKDGITDAKTVVDYVMTVVSQSGKAFAYNIIPMNLILGGLAGLLLIVSGVKQKSHGGMFLLTWIFAFAPALPFGGWNMKHLLVGVGPAISILLGTSLWAGLYRFKILFYTVLLALLVSNIFMIIRENKNGQTIFPLQTDLVLSKEINVIDFTYRDSDMKPFSVSSLTSPLFVNTLWSYLYNWYGYSKYGYLPSWVGRDQIGQLGNNLAKTDGDVDKHYFIIEPTYGIPELWVKYALGDQDAMSVFLKDYKQGDLVVQERASTNN